MSTGKPTNKILSKMPMIYSKNVETRALFCVCACVRVCARVCVLHVTCTRIFCSALFQNICDGKQVLFFTCTKCKHKASAITCITDI